MVVLQAGDPMEAIRLGAPRLFVIRRGRVVARQAPRSAQVFMDNRTFDVDSRRESGVSQPVDRSSGSRSSSPLS